MELLKESSDSPKLATFWYIDGEIVGKSCEPRDGEVSFDGKFYSCPYAHIDIWDEFEPIYGHTFLHYPRGRIGYAVMSRSFYVIGESNMVKDPTFQQAIIRKYNLPGKVDFIPEGHYDLDE